LIRGSILITNIPQITNIKNINKEYYLTDVFAQHKKYSNIPIHIYDILQNNNWIIQGVNTQEELERAEYNMRIHSKYK
jgi:bifunctional N-acetylglucosamine-1-phosphate-uridyltransferase/glucosamine-1-phosphate-acetyltransferase GlmU-like protein